MDSHVHAPLLDAEADLKDRGDDPLERVPGPLAPMVPIWFGLLGAPIAAITHLQALYVFEHTACATGSKIAIHLVTLLLLGVVVAAGFVAHHEWVKLGRENPKQYPGPLGSRRLMALLGMIDTIIFGLFIVAQWFPSVVLGPCVRT
jgi:hypothetical protein